jgi:hypothetical protein
MLLTDKGKTLLDPKKFVIHCYEYEDYKDLEAGKAACQALIDSWDAELETNVLNAFIDVYNDEGFDGHEQSMMGMELANSLPDVETPKDLLERITTMKAHDNFWHNWLPGEQDADLPDDTAPHVVLTFVERDDGKIECHLNLDCPWSYEIGWGARFLNGELLEVDLDLSVYY